MNKFCLFVVIMLLSVLNCFSQSYDLNFNLEKGKIYKLKHDVVQTTIQNMMGNIQEVETTISTIMAFEVKEKTQEFILVDVSINEMLFNMKSAMFSMEYDSKKAVKDGDLLGKIYSKVIGKKYSVLIDKKGEVKQVDGLNSLINSIIEDCNIVKPEAKEQMDRSVKQMFGEAVVKGNMEMLTNIFPKQKVKIGDKWNNKVSLETVMPVDYSNLWELKGVDSEVVAIVGDANIQSKITEEWNTVNGIPTKYDIKGNQNSEINIDRKSGWIISSSIESSMKGKIIMDKCDKLPQKMEIPIEIKTVTKYKSIN